MKKILLLLFIFFIFVTGEANSGWYPSGVNTAYNSGSQPGIPCIGNGCARETVPHVTNCFNSDGGVIQKGDNIPVGDNRSSVFGTSPGPSSIFDPSDNTNYTNSLSPVATSGNMTCYYWDSISYNKTNYSLDVSPFSPPIWVADGIDKILNISFQLKTIQDGVTSNINLNNTSAGIDTINLTFKFLDNTYLDQYLKTGTAVESVSANSDSTDPTTKIRTITYNIDLSNLASYSDLINNLKFKYKFYNSTILVNSVSSDDFILQNLTYDVKFKGGATYTGKYIYNNSNNLEINGSTIPIKVIPLYQSSLSSTIRSDGFLPSVTQSGSIGITKNSFASNSIPNLYLEFGSGTTHNSLSNINIEEKKSSIMLGEGNPNKTFFTGSILSGNVYNIFTYMTQSGAIDSLKNLYLSSHITFSLGGKSVIYNGDIIGFDHYWGASNLIYTFQKGLKILGITHSQKETDLTTNQASSDLHLIGNITKSYLVRDIRKKAFSLIKQLSSINYSAPSTPTISNISGNSWLEGTNDGTNVNGILYFGNLNGNNVILEDAINKLGGKKTIVVYGGNLYIKSNVINNSTSDILGIIVLSDNNNNGGNLYIDPSITNLDAAIYTDKSIISYSNLFDNGLLDSIKKHEVDGQASQYLLRNQLYIRGTVFSNNTIGGSAQTPALCPLYAKNSYDTFVCDNKTSQKFDLNFLRRYYVKADNSVMNGGIKSIGIDTANEKYPVVIKYNPAIQSTPPPLFSK